MTSQSSKTAGLFPATPTPVAPVVKAVAVPVYVTPMVSQLQKTAGLFGPAKPLIVEKAKVPVPYVNYSPSYGTGVGSSTPTATADPWAKLADKQQQAVVAKPAAVVDKPTASPAAALASAANTASQQIVADAAAAASSALTDRLPVVPPAPDLPSYGYPAAGGSLPGETVTSPSQQSTTDTDGTTVEMSTKVETAIAHHHASWWIRFLNWLGLEKKSITSASTVHGESSMSTASVKEAAESVVRRVRSGDQNAMALMAMVRDNASAGNPNAKISFRFMRMYIEKNPIGGVSAQMGSEFDEGVRWELG